MFIHNLFLFHVSRDEIKKGEQYEYDCLLSDERTVKDILLHISAIDSDCVFTLINGNYFFTTYSPSRQQIYSSVIWIE